ncbi:putative MATE family efflux protein [Bradyrhizobium sp. USDA 4369]
MGGNRDIAGFGHHQLLEKPILSALVNLSTPTVSSTLCQIAAQFCEVFFIGQIGTVALAGMGLVYPAFMLMLTMATNSLGSSVTSAIARALGAGRRAEANLLVIHAAVISVAGGCLFMCIFLVAGPALYVAMGGTNEALDEAIRYSDVLFGGAIAFWLVGVLMAIVRASGNVKLPANVAFGTALVKVSLSPLLMFGIGPIPGLGLQGAAIAAVAYCVIGSAVLLVYLFSGHAALYPSLAEFEFRLGLFWEMLRVSLPGMLNNAVTNLMVLFLITLVASYGTLAVAAYGVALRIEYLMPSIVFGFGTSIVTLVGTNIGANKAKRAKRAGWFGGFLTSATTGGLGFVLAIFSEYWATVFSSDQSVAMIAASYFRLVGPSFAFLGLALALYYYFIGTGNVLPAVSARITLALCTGIASWVTVHVAKAEISWLFGVMAASFSMNGIIMGALLHRQK